MVMPKGRPLRMEDLEDVLKKVSFDETKIKPPKMGTAIMRKKVFSDHGWDLEDDEDGIESKPKKRKPAKDPLHVPDFLSNLKKL